MVEIAESEPAEATPSPVAPPDAGADAEAAPTIPSSLAPPPTAVPVTLPPVPTLPPVYTVPTVPTSLADPAPTLPVERIPQTLPTVPPSLPTTTTAAPRYLSVGQAGIARVPYNWSAAFPNWTVVVMPGREGVRALTFPDTNRVELYVRSDDTPGSVARVFAHELGHVIDLELNSQADRDAWRAARGAPNSVPWWPSGQTYDFDTMAGDFAEAVAAWLVGSSSQSRVGGGFTTEQLVLVAQLAR